MNAMKRRAGFSLIELVISVAILLILVVALTYLFGRQSRTYTVVDQVSEAQQSLRAIAGLMERELRTTAFMVPEAAAFCGFDDTDDSDFLFVTDSDALDPDGQTLPELGASITAGYAGTGSNEALSVDGIVVDATPFYDLDGDGTADSDFLYDPGNGRTGGVIVVDRDNPQRGTSCGVLVGIAANSLVVDFTLGGQASIKPGTPLAAPPPGSTDLVAVPAHYYRVNGNGQLVRDGMVLAEDVEDLQFALFYDVDGDGVVGAPSNELPGSDPAVPTYDSANWDNRVLREIRLAFVVRTQAEDRDVLERPGQAQNTFQTTFNRQDPGGSDGFRRRVHRTRLRPRNVGLR